MDFLCSPSYCGEQGKTAYRFSAGRNNTCTLPEKFFTAVYNNPATHFFAHESSLTRLSIYSTYNKKNGTYLLQEGNGGQLFGADVSSWLNLSGKTKVWGNASYITGKKRQIKWNETSDFELLYPYVMADTIGGDQQTEQYRFSGGYSGKGRLFTWGLQAAYRSKIEYRDRDPRPKNVVSDFNIEAGGSVPYGAVIHIRSRGRNTHLQSG